MNEHPSMKRSLREILGDSAARGVQALHIDESGVQALQAETAAVPATLDTVEATRLAYLTVWKCIGRLAKAPLCSGMLPKAAMEMIGDVPDIEPWRWQEELLIDSEAYAFTSRPSLGKTQGMIEDILAAEGPLSRRIVPARYSAFDSALHVRETVDNYVTEIYATSMKLDHALKGLQASPYRAEAVAGLIKDYPDIFLPQQADSEEVQRTMTQLDLPELANWDRTAIADKFYEACGRLTGEVPSAASPAAQVRVTEFLAMFPNAPFSMKNDMNDYVGQLRKQAVKAEADENGITIHVLAEDYVLNRALRKIHETSTAYDLATSTAYDHDQGTLRIEGANYALQSLLAPILPRSRSRAD